MSSRADTRLRCRRGLARWLARPPPRAVRRRDAQALLVLGITTGLVTIAFLAAINLTLDVLAAAAWPSCCPSCRSRSNCSPCTT